LSCGISSGLRWPRGTRTFPRHRWTRPSRGSRRDLVDDSVATEGVVDIFAAAGLERVDLSILDDAFLQTFKDRPSPNLTATFGPKTSKSS
jgi:hypothetical protein